MTRNCVIILLRHFMALGHQSNLIIEFHCKIRKIIKLKLTEYLLFFYVFIIRIQFWQMIRKIRI